MSKIQQAYTLFDQYNQNAPESITYRDTIYPSEYFYALKLHEWVLKLEPNASEALLLASRCQHIGRWEIARKSYPDGRMGYLRWRSDLSKFHAKKSEEILRSIDYSDGIIKRVKEIVLKKAVKRDNEVQVIEDALCLVFLEFQYEALIKTQSEEKMINILQKTLVKMSESGKQNSQSFNFSDLGKTLLFKATNAS
jgi:hypothetical protein